MRYRQLSLPYNQFKNDTESLNTIYHKCCTNKNSPVVPLIGHLFVLSWKFTQWQIVFGKQQWKYSPMHMLLSSLLLPVDRVSMVLAYWAWCRGLASPWLMINNRYKNGLKEVGQVNGVVAFSYIFGNFDNLVQNFCKTSE